RSRHLHPLEGSNLQVHSSSQERVHETGPFHGTVMIDVLGHAFSAPQKVPLDAGSDMPFPDSRNCSICLRAARIASNRRSHVAKTRGFVMAVRGGIGTGKS